MCWLAPLTQCHCPVHVHYGLDFHLPGPGVPCQEPWLSPCTYQVRATSSSHHVMVDILHSHCSIGHSFTIRVKKKPQVNILHEPVQRLLIISVEIITVSTVICMNINLLWILVPRQEEGSCWLSKYQESLNIREGKNSWQGDDHGVDEEEVPNLNDLKSQIIASKNIEDVLNTCGVSCDNKKDVARHFEATHTISS